MMHILSEGTPMTAGEVFSLIRRRRDERNAACHPPFCLQRSQADTQSRASSNYVAQRFNRNNNNNKNNNSSNIGEINQLLAAPGAGNLVVMLTEVRVLSYFAHRSHLTNFGTDSSSHQSHNNSNNNHSMTGPISIYGPPSVYQRERDADSTVKAEGQQQQEEQLLQAVKSEPAYDEDGEEQQIHKAQEKALKETLMRTRPGTTEHVGIVRALADLYEERGRSAEMLYASKIKAILREIRGNGGSKYTSNSNNNGHASSCVKSENDNEESGNTHVHVDAAAARLRPLLAAPTSIMSSHAHGSSDGSAANSYLLNESEVMQLVVGQPRSAFEVYRLIDDLEGKCGQREDVLEHFVNEVAKVFTS